MLLVFLMYALFASVFTVGKNSLNYAEPFFFVGFRMSVAGAILLLFLFFTERKQFFLQKNQWGKILSLAFFNIFITNILEIIALRSLSSFKTCFFYNLSPFISALISYLLFSETLSWKKWLGLFIAFCGFIPLIYDKSTFSNLSEYSFSLSLPEIAMLIAVVSSVYGWTLLRQIVKDMNCSPMSANGYGMFLGGILALLTSYFFEEWKPLPVSDLSAFLPLAFYSIIVSNLICYNLYGVLTKKFSVTFLTLAGFTTSIFTALYGWLFLEETVSVFFYTAAFLVFAGLLIFSQDELKTQNLNITAKIT